MVSTADPDAEPPAPKGAGADWLEPIATRHAVRFRRQRREIDLLPPRDTDFAPMKPRVMSRADGPSDRARKDISHQAVALSEKFEGASELEFLHALCISYLRRRTATTAKARRLFRRMWHEEPDFLLERLSARWLISALQTFYDHGVNPGERMAGAVGFMYGNLIKVYESERQACRTTRPSSPLDYRPRLAAVETMGGFKPGDDVLLNIHVLAYDAAVNGGVAGPVLLTLIDKVRNGRTIFRRTDELGDDPEFAARRSYTPSFGRPHSAEDAEDDADDTTGDPDDAP